MSDSETSSQPKIGYKNTEEITSPKKKPQTTDTDYHFDVIANPNKILEIKKETSELTELSQINDTSESDSSKKSSVSEKRKSDSDKRKSDSDKRKSDSDKRKSDSEKVKPTYEKIKVPFIPSVPVIEVKQMTPQEIRMKKIELLRRLSEIKTKGYNLSRDYNFESSIEEMEYEYDSLKSFADKRNGIKIYKNILLNVTSAVEFLNDKYDPFDFHLAGWSEHMSVEVDSYDEVLEEIYEKYKGGGKKMPPEIKLMLLIVASASAFHFTKSQSTTIPGLDTILANNPGIIGNMMNNKKQSQFVTPQELNIEKMRQQIQQKQQQQHSKQQQLQEQLKRQQQEQMKNQQQEQMKKQQENQMYEQQIKMLEDQIKKQQTVLSEPVAANSKPRLPSPKATVITTPDNVKDILNRIHNKSNSNTKNNDRLVSETTISDSSTKRKTKAKKSNISII
jgi:predicted Holliday junction resolvase-like endonuclease